MNISTVLYTYAGLVTAIWGMFAFPERLLKDDVLEHIAAFVAAPVRKPRARWMLETIINVGNAVFRFRETEFLLLFLPSVRRFIAIYLALSLIGTTAVSIVYFLPKPLQVYVTTDLPLLLFVIGAASIFAAPADYLSTIATRMVLEDALRTGGRTTTLFLFLGDLVFKVSLFIWLSGVIASVLPPLAKSFVRTFYPHGGLPWFATAAVELSLGGYVPWYFVLIASTTMFLLLAWGLVFVVAVFLFSGLSETPRLFALMHRYLNIQRRPLSLMAFFLILAITPVYLLACFAYWMFLT